MNKRSSNLFLIEKIVVNVAENL